MKSTKQKQIIKILIYILIPVVIVAGATAFGTKKYAFLSIVVMLLACVPFFVSFEKKNAKVERMLALAVLTAISILGRYIFGFIPHFKPITAMVIITGIYMGGEMGFLCGALSAVVSNFIFGQGPWTTFQMFAWGFTGLMAGVFAKQLKENKPALLLYACLAGLSYSLMLDVWSTIWAEGEFNIKRYVGYIITSIPTTLTYIVSNIMFLLILTRPIGEKLDRIRKKYGI
ncbi:MAG: ECF transporter S component [Clostridiales bacterium]|nr:ECF transporter S component [Clostridiales bacterium]